MKTTLNIDDETLKKAAQLTGITEKTGSDFDIDKMYLMIPSFIPKFEKKDEQQVSNFFADKNFKYRDIQAELVYLGINPETLTREEAYQELIYEILYNGHKCKW